ncbi:MAG: hypothetical protein JWM10_4617 [Myxococcaceae bacterium]|nr:hypothetical protein [Myxococcaceae bacterium]
MARAVKSAKAKRSASKAKPRAKQAGSKAKAAAPKVKRAAASPKPKTDARTSRTSAKAPPTKQAPEKPTPEATAEVWLTIAADAPTEPRWSVPWFVLMQEAAVASAFVEARWKRSRGEGRNAPVILGLESVATHLPATVAAEIRDLHGLAQREQQAFLLRTRPATGDDPRPRADHVLGEVTAALEFLFDDGVEDERDARLGAVGRAHEDDGDSHAAVASALEDYGALAGEYRSELDGLGGFDAALLDEIPGLAAALRSPPSGGATERSPAATEALHRRNRFGNLLHDRIARVRSAAQFVFRTRPEIVREVTSTYLRRKRAAARRANATKTPKTEKVPA